ncbi:molybdopterin molybdenumtransferase MoeA [Streptomyces albus]|uniref:molybdopterin molybdotransferase MoeA n=1 Tax=Streptomyces albus TaxID=1888 RepID=UPI0013B47B3C|nr:molybdopterin molybdotransferase MoeA [Streptomyces albus]QID37237.1 molybdopterin molybdenumtransferase MoeA [Streptomyces albus]GHJ23153.1 molybdopterin molybdenumtransferase MoeA [Streptomyces albus]
MSGSDELDEAIALANSGRARPTPPPAPRLKRIRRIRWDDWENLDEDEFDPGPGEDEEGEGEQPAWAGQGARSGTAPGQGPARGGHPGDTRHGDQDTGGRNAGNRGKGDQGTGGRSGEARPGGAPSPGAPSYDAHPADSRADAGTDTGGTARRTASRESASREARHTAPRQHGDRSRVSAATWSEAVATAAGAADALPSATVPLDRALGHTLAAAVTALTDLPPFDTSAMDGWAVCGPGPWVPARTADGAERPGLLAGDRSEPPQLADGEAIRIATGARVPPGTSAVLRWEAAERIGGARLRSPSPPQAGADIRPRGQECREGDALLPPGRIVTPPVLGLAAAAGYDELEIVPRPRAEVLVLGDELLHSGLPRDGRIRDALGPMVGPWLTALGAEVVATRMLGDDAEALHEAVSGTTADLIVTTGGTARGPVDHLQPTLRRMDARLLVRGVRVRPGHPMLLAALRPQQGRRRGSHLVGLPGNPLAALSGLVTLAAPLLRALAGRAEPELRKATLGAEVSGHPRDTRLVPVRHEGSGIRARIRPLRYAGPSMLRGVASCDALAVVPPGGAAPGEDVPLVELPW